MDGRGKRRKKGREGKGGGRSLPLRLLSVEKRLRDDPG